MTDSRSSLFSLSIIVFARLFQKAVSSTDSGGRTPQSAKSSSGVFFLIAFSFAPVYAKEKADRHKFFALSVSYTLGFARRVEHCSPAKKYKVTFLLSYFSMTKSTKSHQRERSPLFANSPRVHELVARAIRGECVRHRVKQKSAVLPLPAASAIPRVRTYHTKKPSRFVHALSARPHNRVGGRGWSPCADRMKLLSLLTPHPSACG